MPGVVERSVGVRSGTSGTPRKLQPRPAIAANCNSARAGGRITEILSILTVCCNGDWYDHTGQYLQVS